MTEPATLTFAALRALSMDELQELRRKVTAEQGRESADFIRVLAEIAGRKGTYQRGC